VFGERFWVREAGIEGSRRLAELEHVPASSAAQIRPAAEHGLLMPPTLPQISRRCDRGGRAGPR
jgi:hypothetical protein